MGESEQFVAQIKDWSKRTERNMMLVVMSAAQKLAHEMGRPVAEGGNMRVRTGFLRWSLRASLTSMPTIDPNAKPGEGGSYSEPPGVIAAILGMQKDKPLYLGYTASYAYHREFTHGDAFVRSAAQRWQEFVEEAAKEIAP